MVTPIETTTQIGTNPFTMQNEITNTTTVTSIFSGSSPLVGLLWFETIAACITYGLGCIGNLLLLYVFSTQEEFRKISTGLLYLLITVFNAIHLGALGVEFLQLYNVTLYAGTVFQCSFNFFIQNTTRATSIYLTVAVALDRLIRSEFPHRSRLICTKKNVIILTIIMVIIFSAIWSFYLYQMSAYDASKGICNSPSAAYSFFTKYVHHPMRALIVCLIPAIIIIASNLRLMMNIRLSRQRVHAGMMTNALSIDTATLTIPNQNKKNTHRITAFDRMILYMMMVNVSTLLVTLLPFQLYLIIRTYGNTSSAYVNKLIRSFMLIWSSIYFGIGFYIYCLAVPLFRRRVIKIIKTIFKCRADQSTT